MTRFPGRRLLSNMDDGWGDDNEYDLNGVMARILMDAGDPGEWEHINESGDSVTNWVWGQ